MRELWKVVFNLRLARLYLLRQQVLLVEEENHRNRPQPSVQIASHEKPINEVYSMAEVKCHSPVIPDALEEVE